MKPHTKTAGHIPAKFRASGFTREQIEWLLRPEDFRPQIYSGHDLDRASTIASQLSESDRAAGWPAPKFGYSQERFDQAARLIAAARKAGQEAAAGGQPRRVIRSIEELRSYGGKGR